MSNKRIFYACQSLAIYKSDMTNPIEVHGLQSVGITTTFNLEQVFEIGQLAIYENIETVPDIEVTTEKVLDGYPPIFLLATKEGACPTLIQRSKAKCSAMLSIYKDTSEQASGVGQHQVLLSGLFPTSVGYTMPAEGNSTESVTLAGYHKFWGGEALSVSNFGTDAPKTGVQRREDFLMATSLLPTEIRGINAQGGNITAEEGGGFKAKITNIKVNCDLGREALFELGKRTPYHRYVSFPVEVTAEFTTIGLSGDLVDADGDATSNISNQTIDLKMADGLRLNLGEKNKLQSVGYSGGDAGGDNVEITYNYQTFNDFTVTHPHPDVAASGMPH